MTVNIEYKISEESARDSLARLLLLYDIDIETAKLFLQLSCEDLIKHIRTGRVEIDISDDPAKNYVVAQNLRYPIQNVSRLEYGELVGEHAVLLGKKSSAENTAERQYTILALLAKEDIKTFYKLRRVDKSIAETLGTIFLLL